MSEIYTMRLHFCGAEAESELYPSLENGTALDNSHIHRMEIFYSGSSTFMAVIPKCQPCPKPAPYKWKPKEAGPKGPGPNPTSSVKSPSLAKKQCQNLTTYDWLTIFAYIDKHPDETQTDVVNFF